MQGERVSSLRLIAQNVASFSNLRALLVDTDQATVFNFLKTEVLRRNPQADLVVVLDPAGRLIARTDTEQAAAMGDVTRWTQQALENGAVIELQTKKLLRKFALGKAPEGLAWGDGSIRPANDTTVHFSDWLQKPGLPVERILRGAQPGRHARRIAASSTNAPQRSPLSDSGVFGGTCRRMARLGGSQRIGERITAAASV